MPAQQPRHDQHTVGTVPRVVMLLGLAAQIAGQHSCVQATEHVESLFHRSEVGVRLQTAQERAILCTHYPRVSHERALCDLIMIARDDTIHCRVFLDFSDTTLSLLEPILVDRPACQLLTPADIRDPRAISVSVNCDGVAAV